MTARSVVIVWLMASACMVWGADRTNDLSKARSDYRQSVAQHGANSLEAKQSRQRLRATRRAFHTERRNRRKE